MLKYLLRASLFIVLCLFALQTAAQEPLPEPGPTLNAILSRGELLCGVNPDLPGFGFLDPNTGQMRGFEVDLCRALAAAIFADSSAVNLIPYMGDSGLAAIADSEIDVLLHNVVMQPALDRAGLTFGPIMFYNGQTLMVRNSALSDWPNLSGTTICVSSGSAAAAQLPAELARHGISAQLLALPTLNEAVQALQDGRCEAQSADRVSLEQLRQEAADPSLFTLWPNDYTHEPFAPLLRYGDQQWDSIVRWTLWGLIRAEELGVNSENVTSLARQVSGNTPEELALYTQRVGVDVARMLDWRVNTPDTYGLQPNFLVPVLREIGNYGEIYQRYLGLSGDLPLERGLNRLAQNGGLIYAPSW